MSTGSGSSALEAEVDLPVGPSLSLVSLGLRIASLAAFVGLWWAVSTAGVVVAGIDFSLLPRPPVVAEEFAAYLAGEPMTTGGQSIYVHVLYSTWRVAAGVGIATVLGVGLGLLIGTSREWADFVYPGLELFRPIPPVAWVPISILLFPTLSLTALSVNLAVLFVVFIGAFFPILVNTVEGVRNVEEEYRQAAESLGAGRTQVFRHVILPATLPAILTGISLGIGLGWITVVAAEIIAGNYGVGYALFQAYRVLATETVVVMMITIGALGYASSWLVVKTADRLTPWSSIETNR